MRIATVSTLCSNFSILVHSGSTIIHAGDKLLLVYHNNYHIMINLVCNKRSRQYFISHITTDLRSYIIKHDLLYNQPTTYVHICSLHIINKVRETPV